MDQGVQFEPLWNSGYSMTLMDQWEQYEPLCIVESESVGTCKNSYGVVGSRSVCRFMQMWCET